MDLADLLVTTPNRPAYDKASDIPAWLMAWLHTTQSPATRIGSTIKALLPLDRGGAVKYAQFCVAILPDGVSAASIRPGGVNSLAKYMPAELVVHVTGHELKNSASALWEYIDAQLALCMPGALVLAGWPAVPWGHNGSGPSPA